MVIPMKDLSHEISSIINLILPLNDQLPSGDKFVEQFLDQHSKHIFKVKPKQIKFLKSKFKGRVSFLKAVRSTVKKVYIGKKVGKLKHLIVDIDIMSKHQTKGYSNAVKKDSTGESGINSNARQASLFVFPDYSWGNEGFNKYLTKKPVKKSAFKINKNDKQEYNYSLGPELTKALNGINNNERLKKLYTYSSKYASVIDKIINHSDKQNIFIYSQFKTGSGLLLFTEILKLFKFSKANGKEGTSKGKRFALLTGNNSASEIERIVRCFNQEKNKHGDIIKIIAGTSKIVEGISFYNIQQEFILTPWYNFSETSQAIARGYRIGSHNYLINNGETPILKITLCVSTSRKNKVVSTDLEMYELAEDKDISIKNMLRLLMESSFDCALNYFRNYISGQDGKQDCDYMGCDYVCDGINMKYVKKGLPKNKIDYSTYELYYSNPNISQIKKDIEKFLKNNSNIDLQTIINYFNNDYNEWEIKNALKSLVKNSSDKLFYKDYVKLYSLSNVSKIMLKIEQMFKTNFRLNFKIIKNNLKQYTIFEILTSLKNLIDKSFVIKNKYGFSSYIREENNIYFLVNNLSVNNDSYADYYSQYPNIINTQPFSVILNNTHISLMPNIISTLFTLNNSKMFYQLIKTIPKNIQELLIESSILAKQQNINKNINSRDLILDYFENYIYNVKDTIVSNRLKNIRCLHKNKKVWKNCPDTYSNLLDKQKTEHKDVLEDNPYGYYGKYNPEIKDNNGNVFCIVNINEQKRKREQDKEKITKKLQKDVDNDKITQDEMDKLMNIFKLDYRKKYPGKNCRQGWSIPDLLHIAVKILKLDYPIDFLSNKSDKQMISYALKDKEILNIYKPDELQTLDSDSLRRLLYWGTKKSSKLGGIRSNNELCIGLENWFKTHTYKNSKLYISDNECGVGGGHTKKEKTKEETIEFNIETIIPSQDKNKFKTFENDISKLMTDCFGIKKYKPDIDDKIWIFAKKKNKIIGFLTLDNNNVIWNVCISKYYRNKGIAKNVIQSAIKQSCPDNPRLLVDQHNKFYNKLIKLYTSIGFTILKNDGKITTMIFSCNLK
jgi:ribosomal protein S18 acetylase RimI-like enzyme